MSTATDTERPTYGNWIAQRSPGLFGAGLVGTVVLFGGVVLSLALLLLAGLTVALWGVGVTVAAFTITGTPAGSWLHRRAVYGHAAVKQELRHRSGVFAPKDKLATSRLPGMLGQSQLLEATDAFGARFAVVRSVGGLYSIVARCLAEGPWMQDRSRVDGWVAGYSTVLDACGAEAGLVCAKAITDTAPDPGHRLEGMVRSLRTDGGPELARTVMDELVAELPAASSENVTYLELTFKGRSINRKGDEPAILAELARKVPPLIGLLQGAGGGSVDMVTPDELARVVRVSYDPATQPQLELAEVDGTAEPVEWSEAGPVASQDLWGSYVHDSGHSITYEMTRPPRSKITELALARLLAPHADFTRKRVALIYRPHTPDESARVSERDANTANFVAQQSKKRPSASAQLVMRAAEQSRQEVASGASSVRFSLLVTVTMLTPTGDVPQAVSTLTTRAGAVPISVRRSYGAQAAGFAATLPVGFVPWEHTAVSQKVREWL